MEIEQALQEKAKLDAALLAKIRKFEETTGLQVDSLRLVRIDSSHFGEERSTVIVRAESRVLLEGAGQ